MDEGAKRMSKELRVRLLPVRPVSHFMHLLDSYEKKPCTYPKLMLAISFRILYHFLRIGGPISK